MNGRLERAAWWLFLVIAILPMLFSLGYAAAYSLGLVGLLSEGFTLEHWGKLFAVGEVWISLGYSLYLAALTVVLTVGGALLVTFLLRPYFNRGALSYIVYFPLAVPATVAAFLVFQFFSDAGFASRMALNLGLIDQAGQFPDMVHDRFGLGIITAHVALAIPFFILLFGQIYQSERVGELLRLTRTLGGGAWDGLIRVSIPILLSRAKTNISLLFMVVFGSYEIPLLLGRQAPQMISVLTLRKYAMFDITQKPQAFIAALLYTVLVLALLVPTLRGRRPA